MAEPKATTEVIGLKEPDSFANAKKRRMKKYEENKANEDLDTDSKTNDNDDYNPICWRFPSLPVCGCTRPCREAVKTVQIFGIKDVNGLFVGPIHGAYKHNHLYNTLNIRYILNVSNEKYLQNDKLFKLIESKS